MAHQRARVPPHLKGAVSAAAGREIRVLSLDCILLSPKCLDEPKLLPGLSQRVAMGSAALLSAGLRRHRDDVGSALLLDDPRRAAAILAVSLGSP